MVKNKYVFWPGLGVLLVGAVVLSLGEGSSVIPPGQVLQALLTGDTVSTVGRILWFVRLPRTLASVLAGAALAVAGGLLQRILRNPMASPGVIGVNACAGFAVALLCALAPGAQRAAPAAAFLGALTGVTLVTALSRLAGSSRTTVVLAGLAVSQVFSAGIDAVITLVPEALMGVSDFRIGGFSGVQLDALMIPGIMILLALGCVSVISMQLDILALGQDTARSLGLRSGLVRTGALLLCAVLAGAAVSFGGLIGFVGLMVPNAVRKITGEESLPLLTGCALGGALLVTVCDLLARVLFAPYELSVGIVLAFVGGPFFLGLLLKHRGGRI